MLLIGLGNVSLAEASDWKHYQRGVELLSSGKVREAIVELEKAAAISSKASTLRKLAEAYERNQEFQKAANTYYQEAEIHRKRGDTQTYLAVKAMADSLHSDIDIFVDLKVKTPSQMLGKYEPSTGMYFGAYIEQDRIAKQSGNKYGNFNNVTGKKHSVFFVYHRYGQDFPTNFAKLVKDVGGAIHISMQPESGLAAVKDDTYLRKFARAAKDAGVPIFLRFASEMNGSWVKWHGNPSLYKQKFQLVSKVMKEDAPNIAMAWVPNSVPANTINDYYPGDEWVDWVGVNLYSVPFFNGKASEPADDVNPLDLLDPIYKTYANRKPIMIGEYGASHFSSVRNQDKTKFGVTKMSMFYQGLRMKYPRVKAVHWFSVNTLDAPYVTEDRRLNNFSLTEKPAFLQAYKNIIQHPYFLSDVVNGLYAKEETQKGSTSVSLSGSSINESVNGIGFIKTYDPYVSKVAYHLNDKFLSESNQYPFSFKIDFNLLKTGTNKLEVVVYDSKNKVASRKTVSFQKGEKITDLTGRDMILTLGNRVAYTADGPMLLLVAPFTKEQRTLVPLRFISENLGANVGWNGSRREITVELGKNKIILVEGMRQVKVNGKNFTIEAAPEILNGTTFVPLRFIAEQLGSTINYESSTRAIIIK